MLQGIEKARLDLRREGVRIGLDCYADIRKTLIHNLTDELVAHAVA
jgi:hypothetical protein